MTTPRFDARRIHPVRSAFMLLLMLGISGIVCLAGSSPEVTHTIPPAPASSGLPGRLAGLPLAAQGPVSASLGSDDREYWVQRSVGGLVAVNHAQGLRARFGGFGATITAASVRLGLGLVAIGRGRRLARVRRADPRAQRNRVFYRFGEVSEWFANGPLGLEQGFTVRRSQSGQVGDLTLTLGNLGNMRPVLADRSRSVVLQTTDGRPKFRYVGLVANDARGRSLTAHLAVAHGRLLIVVDPHGAQYPLKIDPILQPVELTTTDGGGGVIAISGHTIAMGGGAYGGHVYVFSEPTSGWANATQTAELSTSESDVEAVAISGGTIVAGVAGPPNVNDDRSGVVDVFTEPTGGWTNAIQPAELTASDSYPDDALGASVAISGGTIVAGAPGHPSDLSGPGAVYVFTEPTAGWTNATQTAELTASDGATYEDLGASVAISGGTVVAGAPGYMNRGALYVFNEPVSGWTNATQAAELTAADGGRADDLGQSVAISGGAIVAGAPQHMVGQNLQQGAVYVFVERPGSGWTNATQTAELTALDGNSGDKFGTWTAISGGSIVVGAPLHDMSQTVLYIFDEPASGWTNASETTELTASNSNDDDEFGAFDPISGDTIITAGGGGQGADEFGAPVITTAPVIAGSLAVGDTLSESHGAWSESPTAYTYQWYDCDGSGHACSAIGGATGSTYTLTAADLGHTIVVEEAASNVLGASNPASSVPTAIVTAAPDGKPGSAGKGSLTLGLITTGGSHAAITVTCTGSRPCTSSMALSTQERVRGEKIVAVAAALDARAPAGQTHAEIVTVARSTFTVPAGAHSTIHLSLNATGERLLDDFYRLPARLSLPGSGVSDRSLVFSYRRITSPVPYSWTWTYGSSYTTAKELTVEKVPMGGLVTVDCRGHGCPFAKRTFKAHNGQVQLTPAFATTRLQPGARLEIEITAANHIGKVLVFAIRSDAAPKLTEECLPPGEQRPAACV